MRKFRVAWAYLRAIIYCYFHPSQVVYTEEDREENKASRVTLVGTATGDWRSRTLTPQKIFYREEK